MSKSKSAAGHFTLRDVRRSDAKALLEIYSPYIHSSHITFETEVPSQSDYEARIEKVTSKYPWIVAELDGQIIGFAYANLFRERAAYGYALESSIYVADAHQRSSIAVKPETSVASALYEALFTRLRSLGTKQVIGVISLPNEKSVRFHEKLGFQSMGVFPSVGYKLEQWWDVLFMSKFLEDLPFTKPTPAEYNSSCGQNIKVTPS